MNGSKLFCHDWSMMTVVRKGDGWFLPWEKEEKIRRRRKA